jgi:hypothetical protein
LSCCRRAHCLEVCVVKPPGALQTCCHGCTSAVAARRARRFLIVKSMSYLLPLHAHMCVCVCVCVCYLLPLYSKSNIFTAFVFTDLWPRAVHHVLILLAGAGCQANAWSRRGKADYAAAQGHLDWRPSLALQSARSAPLPAATLYWALHLKGHPLPRRARLMVPLTYK